MKKIAVIAFLSVAPFMNAQAFLPARLITIKGDTLQGEAQVMEKKPLMKYEKIIFRDQNGQQKNYKPEKVVSYSMGEEHFISLDNDGFPRFYKVMTSGAINLYELGVEMQVGNKIVPETEYYLSLPGNKKLIGVKTKKFKKQVSDWLKDSPEIAAKYDKEEFDLELAVRVISEYNQAQTQ